MEVVLKEDDNWCFIGGVSICSWNISMNIVCYWFNNNNNNERIGGC